MFRLVLSQLYHIFVCFSFVDYGYLGLVPGLLSKQTVSSIFQRNIYALTSLTHTMISEVLTGHYPSFFYSKIGCTFLKTLQLLQQGAERDLLLNSFTLDLQAFALLLVGLLGTGSIAPPHSQPDCPSSPHPGTAHLSCTKNPAGPGK